MPGLDVVEYEEAGVPKKHSSPLEVGYEEPGATVDFLVFPMGMACWGGKGPAGGRKIRAKTPRLHSYPHASCLQEK